MLSIFQKFLNFIFFITLTNSFSTYIKKRSRLPRIKAEEDNQSLTNTNNLPAEYTVRFNNIGRLYGGNSALEKLYNANVCVVGLGGVGSWAAEALARSGVGSFTVVDIDDVCVSNINRQLVAQSSTIGKFKAEVVKNRILDINPFANVTLVLDFLRDNNVEDILIHQNHQPNDLFAKSSPDKKENIIQAPKKKFDFIVDAIDGLKDKAAIIDICERFNISVASSGGVGGLTDPSLLRISDLASCEGDVLLSKVRRKLRVDYGFPKSNEKLYRKVKKWGIPVIHTLPTSISRRVDKSKSEVDIGFRKCDYSFGNACFVTGTAGFMLAGIVVDSIANNKLKPPKVNRRSKSDVNNSIKEIIDLETNE